MTLKKTFDKYSGRYIRHPHTEVDEISGNISNFMPSAIPFGGADGKLTDQLSGISYNSNTGLTLSGGIKLEYGARVTEFSIDGTLSGNSDLAVPTEQAVKTYVDTENLWQRQAGSPGTAYKLKPKTAGDKITTTLILSGSNNNAVEGLCWPVLGANQNASTTQNGGYFEAFSNSAYKYGTMVGVNAGSWNAWPGATADTIIGVKSKVYNDGDKVRLMQGGYFTFDQTGGVVDDLDVLRLDGAADYVISGTIDGLHIDDLTLAYDPYGYRRSIYIAPQTLTNGATVSGDYAIYSENTAPSVLSGGLTLSTGVNVNEFSTDGTLVGNSDDAVPTEQAVKTYVDTENLWKLTGNKVSLNDNRDNIVDLVPIITAAGSWNIGLKCDTKVNPVADDLSSYRTYAGKFVIGQWNPDYNLNEIGAIEAEAWHDYGINEHVQSLYGIKSTAFSYGYTHNMAAIRGELYNSALTQDKASALEAYGEIASTISGSLAGLRIADIGLYSGADVTQRSSIHIEPQTNAGGILSADYTIYSENTAPSFLSGGLTVSGAMNVVTPTTASHAANKAYVDANDLWKYDFSDRIVPSTANDVILLDSTGSSTPLATQLWRDDSNPGGDSYAGVLWASQAADTALGTIGGLKVDGNADWSGVEQVNRIVGIDARAESWNLAQNVIGVWAKPSVRDQTTGLAAGFSTEANVTNAVISGGLYGLHVGNLKINHAGAVVERRAGVYITEPTNIGTVTNDYAIYSENTAPSVLSGGLTIGDSLVLPKDAGYGIKVDTTNPVSASFGWRDIIGYPSLRGNASIDPVWATYRGNISQFEMTTTGKYLTFMYHLPHDYVPGTDIYVHVHWSHISAAVTTGGVTWSFESTYAKGHNQAPFIAPKTTTVNQPASTTQYQHMIAETPLSTSGGSATLLDTDTLEVDGLVIVRINWTVNDMSVATNPFFHTADLHYQSTNMATKQKAPSFYI